MKHTRSNIVEFQQEEKKKKDSQHLKNSLGLYENITKISLEIKIEKQREKRNREFEGRNRRVAKVDDKTTSKIHVYVEIALLTKGRVEFFNLKEEEEEVTSI